MTIKGSKIKSQIYVVLNFDDKTLFPIYSSFLERIKTLATDNFLLLNVKGIKFLLLNVNKNGNRYGNIPYPHVPDPIVNSIRRAMDYLLGHGIDKSLLMDNRDNLIRRL